MSESEAQSTNNSYYCQDTRMKSTHEQLEKINFCDGQIERVELANDEVVVVLKDRQERILRFRFKGVVYFKAFELAGDISEVQIAEDTEEIKEAVRVIEQSGGSAEGYPSLAQVTFTTGVPAVIVVFQEFENES